MDAGLDQESAAFRRYCFRLLGLRAGDAVPGHQTVEQRDELLALAAVQRLQDTLLHLAHGAFHLLGDFRTLGRSWATSGRHSALMKNLAKVRTDEDRVELVEQHRIWGRLVETAAARRPIRRPPPRPPGGKIRLGFMSSDLRQHPVGYFALPLFDHVDNERFEVFVYSYYTGQEDAAQRTASAIKGMVDEAHRAGCIAIPAVGTAGLRMARNSADVLAIIRARTGVKVEIITGDEEGRLAYLAVRRGLPLAAGSLVVFDTGGGSSQFTFGRGDQVADRFSVNVGAVRYTERFGLDSVVSADVLGEAMKAIAEDLSSLSNRPQPETLVAMGGAVTNLTAVSYAMAQYDPEKIQGTVLHRDEIDRQIALYRTTARDTRGAIVGLQPKRADVILAGACIVRTVMEMLGKQEVTVSDRGLRHGVLAERFA